jgi:acyl-coenzyme A synthetase/AMP-(fatty) acid ligase
MLMTVQAFRWSSGEEDTTLAVLRRAVEQSPDTTFLDFDGDKTSYESLFQRVMRLAHGLQAEGVGPGSTVITLLDNNVEAVAAWFAVNAAGGINVPVNTAYKVRNIVVRTERTGAHHTFTRAPGRWAGFSFGHRVDTEVPDAVEGSTRGCFCGRVVGQAVVRAIAPTWGPYELATTDVRAPGT